MADRILVTGINGFVGKHLTRALVEAGYNVDGIIREKDIEPEIRGLINKFETCDLSDKEQVGKLDLSSYRTVINLAGLANVGQSFKQPDLYMKVNVSVLSNICQRVSSQRLKTRVVAISTGAVYDNSQKMPLTEDSRLVTESSPYALSKIAMEAEGKKFRQRGVDCIVARPFNHIGPGQLPGFLVPDLIKQIREAIAQKTSVKVGNLKTKRDYTDVRDVVNAYVMLATKDLAFSTYNICSGRSVAGEKILETILKGMGSPEIEIETDPSLIRPTDSPDIFGSYERLEQETSWRPVLPIEQTIGDALAA